MGGLAFSRCERAGNAPLGKTMPFRSGDGGFDRARDLSAADRP
jgi:hypothetical protein